MKQMKHHVSFQTLVLIVLFINIPGKGKEYWAEENISEEMPACRQMLNIFHPFDPVAYRFAFADRISSVKTFIIRLSTCE